MICRFPTWLLVPCLLAMAPAVLAHGGVSMDEDTCVMQLGPYRAHFTGYQPSVRASQEFCEDIPAVARSIIALDFIDPALRDMLVDFRVIRDVNDVGITATWEDLGGEAAIEAASIYYQQPDRFARGNVNVELAFDAPGAFIGIVTAVTPDSGTTYRSVFPFSVGVRPWYAGWQWIAAIVVGGVLLYWQPWRRRHATNKGGNSSSEAPATGDP